ncbi:MAG TPA: methionine aminotransferase [Chryseosolibacter sp.]|nr:methionine aminotransferase [Chryseosolibacter sp.]
METTQHQRPNLYSRLPEVGTSIFAVMSKMAMEHGAINLSQGFPDFPVDEKLIELVHRYMLEGHNQYAPMPGVLGLREAIAEVVEKTYHLKVSAENNITITAGATQAIHACISAVVKPGDEVIIFDPAYDSYEPAIRLNGGVAVRINLTYPGFSVDWDLVKDSINEKTRLIIINTPHNPTGTVLSDEDLSTLAEITMRHDIYVLSDEVYERILFDQRAHKTVLSTASLAERSMAVYSFGKTFHATGWKCGYIIAPEKLTAEIRKCHQFIVFSVNTPMQWALATYLKTPDHYEQLSRFYQRKRDFFLERIQGTSFKPLPCHGSYFQLMSFENFSDKADVAVAEQLTRELKLATIPLSVFYHDKTDNRLLRFCFAKKEETLEKAAEILRGI